MRTWHDWEGTDVSIVPYEGRERIYRFGSMCGIGLLDPDDEVAIIDDCKRKYPPYYIAFDPE